MMLGKALLALFVLTSSLVIAESEAYAQARGSAISRTSAEEPRKMEGTVRAAKVAELESFLQRLVGKFRYSGTAKLFYGSTDKGLCEGGLCYINRQVEGSGECLSIGTGAGVRCILNVPWPNFDYPTSTPKTSASSEQYAKWPGPFLDDARIFFGLDADRIALRLLLVDSHSVAFYAQGSLKDDRATLTTDCVPPRRCKRIFSIRAKPDSKILELSLELRGGGATLAGLIFALEK